MRRQNGNTPLRMRGPFVIRLQGRIPRPSGYPRLPRWVEPGLLEVVGKGAGAGPRQLARALLCSDPLRRSGRRLATTWPVDHNS